MKFYYSLLIFFLNILFLYSQSVQATLTWAQSFGSNGHDQGLNLCIDQQGYTYLGGYFREQVNFNPKFIRWQAKSNGSEDIFINKYDQDGRMQWAATFGGKFPDRCMASAVDEMGNVFITGFFRDTVIFSTSLINGIKIGLRANEAFIAKLNTNGELLWVKTIHSSNDEQGRTIAVDKLGNVYASGIFQESTNFEGAPELNLNGYKLYDIWITKLNSEGDFLWSRLITGSAEETVSSMIATSKGEIVLTGSFSDQIIVSPGLKGITLSQTSIYNDMYIVKFDTNGELIWAKAIRGDNAVTSMLSTVDNLDQLYFTGFFRSKVDFDPSDKQYNLTAPGVTGDVFVLKLNSNGELIWVKQMGGPNHDVGLGITVDRNYNVLTTGCFQNEADFDPGNGQFILNACCDLNNNDIFITKLDINGNFVWASGFHGEGEDIGFDIVTDTINSRIYSTGLFSKTVDFDPMSDSFNLSSNGFTDIYLDAMDEVLIHTKNPTLSEDFQIIPNPASTILELHLSNLDVQKIELFNYQGRLLDIKNVSINEKMHQIVKFSDINKYSSGIYFIKVNYKNKTITKKLIITDDNN